MASIWDSLFPGFAENQSEADIARAKAGTATIALQQARAAAQARANVRYIAEFLETKAAQIAERKLKSGESAAAAKLTSKADSEYIELLDGYKVAVERDAFFSFKREAADAMIRAWQTMCSNARTEGKAYS